MDVLLTPRELAKYLKVSLPYAYKLSATGAIASVRFPCIGGGDGEKRQKENVRFRLQDVQDFIEKNHRKSVRSGT